MVLVLSLVASALAMHAFAREVTGSRWAALVAGTVWGFWPYHFAHLGHLQLQATYAMPLVALALHRLVARADVARARWRSAPLARSRRRRRSTTASSARSARR